MTNRLIITGGLGHIGSFLLRQPWVGSFDHVLVIDNLLTQRYSSLYNLPSNMNYTFIEKDINDIDWDHLLTSTDTLIHLAAITDAESSVSKKDIVEEVNLKGLQKTALSCLKSGSRFIFPSTTSVYGSQADIVDETCTQLAPQSPYAESKIRAEEYLKHLSQQGLKHVTVRFGTIHGASVGMRFHTAVNKFIWQARWGKPITVWRTALHQYRPYLSLTDASRSLDFIIKNGLFDGGIYNIVTKNHTVSEIIETIKKYTPKLEVSFVDSVIMNQLSYHVLADKIVAKGFHFSGDIDQDVKHTFQLLGLSNA